MREGYLNATKHNPQDIEEYRPCTQLAIPINHIATKRTQGQTGKLEELHTHRDSYDSDAIDNTCKQIAKRHEETTKNYPNQIS